jgi:hypothetical protein
MYKKEQQKKESVIADIDIEEQEEFLTEEYLRIMEEEQEKNQVYVAS